MSESSPSSIDRREFLQAGALATAAAVACSTSAKAADEPAPKPTLPKRPLGKTGVDLTILNQGTYQAPGGFDRIVRFAYASGVRVFDTADCYGTEPGLARWFKAEPEVRKNIFLVTKAHPRRGPRQLIPLLDERLKALRVDHVDLYFIHGIGPGEYGEQSLEWPKSKELKDVVEAIKKSGKAKFVGFSCHDALRPQYLQAAAEGGFLDAIMLQYTPWLERDSALNRALDACWRQGIGLISMKQVAGHINQERVFERAPMLKGKGLKPYQGLLHAIWTDERITTCCVSMRNTDQIRENTDAARRFEPLKQAELDELRDACLAAGPTLCADCDGRCARAAGTTAALGDLTRLLTYHDHHGYRAEARRQYAQLADHERDWRGADLEAARAACPSRLDFAGLLPRVDAELA